MFCPKCGQDNLDNAQFCASCGTALNQAAPVQQSAVVNNAQPAAAKQPGRGMAIASLVLGIVAFLCFPYITGVLAIIFGGVAKKQGFKGGMATAGLVLGIIAIAVQIIATAVGLNELTNLINSLS